MFAVVMLVLQFLRRRLILRIDHFTAGCHLCHFFQNDCIVHCLMSILTPGKRTMILAQYRRDSGVIFATTFKLICDQHTRIVFICLLNLFLGQIADTWNFPVNIIRMRGSITWNITPRLCHLLPRKNGYVQPPISGKRL